MIEDDALTYAVELSTRYILNKHLPDKAIDLIDEAAARKSTLIEKLHNNNEYLSLEKKLDNLHKKIEQAIQVQDYFAAAELKEKEETIKDSMRNIKDHTKLPKHLRPRVHKDDIARVLADKLGIPETQVSASEKTKLKNLNDILSSSIYGQQEAVSHIVNAIKRNKLSVIKRNKPIASFLFL